MLDIIISPDQTGFISEKYISENARLILWLFAIYRGNDIPGVLKMIDFLILFHGNLFTNVKIFETLAHPFNLGYLLAM